MQQENQKKYVLEDIMKKRRKDQQAVDNKIKSKLSLKAKRNKKKQAVKTPDTFIKQYRAAQRSYAHLKHTTKKATNKKFKKDDEGVNKLMLVIRIRGAQDISTQQKIILNKLNLRSINSAVFVKATPTVLRQLLKVQNYITYGEPSLKITKQLIYKKTYGKVGTERVQINSNELVQKHLGGDVICLEDIVNEVSTLGPNFNQIISFIFPFKLTTPPNTLMSRMRKPLRDGGHWGYRGNQIDQYVANMI